MNSARLGLCLGLVAVSFARVAQAGPADPAPAPAPVPSGDVEQVVRGERNFSLALYRELIAGNTDNLFFSPHSVVVALAMTSAGARGDTARAFETVLGFGGEHAHRALGEINAQLATRGQGALGVEGQPFQLEAKNQLFAQDGFPIQSAFLDTLANDYRAALRRLDFERAPETARDAVNTWVSEQTQGRISEILDSVSPMTRLMLVNAVYFNAAWEHQFPEGATAPGQFFRLDGSTTMVPRMRDTDMAVPAATIDGTELFELPYDGETVSMLVMVPPAGTFLEFEQNLSVDGIDGFIAALTPEHLDLSFPKIELRSRAELVPNLARMGLGVAFTPRADFTGINPDVPLSIGEVIHEAFVNVDERGTEAAAATVVGIRATSMPMVRQVVVDRPFLFLIRDRPTGAVVFMGRVTSP